MLAAPDATAQLVKLRETEALGMLDHHQAGVGHIDADLDDFPSITILVIIDNSPIII